MAAQYRWAGRRDNPMRLLRLIASRMRQRSLVIEHCAEIAHIKPAAARHAGSAASLRVCCHVLPSLDLIGISVFEP
jgi:hypothetical protein